MRLLALILIVLAVPAVAQEERADLAACLDSVGAAREATGERLIDPRACIGTVEFLCAELGGDDCLAREEAAWAGLAGEALATLAEAAATPAIADALSQAQADWEDWMAADCELSTPFSEDPGLAAFAASYCRRDAWAGRALTLIARAEGVF